MIFKSGFEWGFDESKCQECGGKCCVGESGEIYANEAEIKLLSEHFGLSVAEFKLKFMRKVGFKLSFKEVSFEGGFACVFFDKIKRNCGIYELRPTQCRTFPFWDYFKKNKEDLKNECIGTCFLG